MAQGRMLKKIICTSKKLATLKTDSSRLLYTWLLPHLDIEGRFSGDFNIIKGHIFPRLKHMTIKKIERDIQDLVKNNLVIVYEAEGDIFLQFTEFHKHQSLRRDREAESDIPAPKNGELLYNDGRTPAQYKLSKDKLSLKQSKDHLQFEKIWEKYPNKVGKKQAIIHYRISVRTENDWRDINKALDNYMETEKVKKGFIQNGSTWFNNWRDYINYKEPKKSSGKLTVEDL